MSKKSTIWLPDHHSTLRSMMAESQGMDYVPLEGFEAARNCPNSIVILEGDDGGTIYLTIPACTVSCSEVALNQLLSDIDGMCWADPTMRRVVYEVLAIGEVVAGGMGGGRVLDGLWLHPEVEKLGVRQDIEDVLRGQLDQIKSAGKRWS